MQKRTSSSLVVVCRFFFPAIFLGWASLMFKGAFSHPGALVFGIPFVLLAAFCLSAAEITANDEFLRYRRFFRWQKVDYKEIRDCRVAWFPTMGRLKLNHSVAPWGTIYFLLPLDPFEIVFPGRQSKFTAFVNARRGKTIRRTDV